MATVLKIGGVEVNRAASRIVLNRLSLSLGGYDTLEFTEVATRPFGSFSGRAAVELIVDGSTLFRGAVVSSHVSGIGTGPINIGYRCNSVDWFADRVLITSGTGAGGLTYNMAPTEDDYLPSLAGLSVGDIIKRVMDLHAEALASVGVEGYLNGDLADLIVVPPERVSLSGGVISAIRGLLAQWQNAYEAWYDPINKVLRIGNLRDLPSIALTLDVDPITLGSVSRDHSESFTRLVIRGGADIQAAYRSFSEETLQVEWTQPIEDVWTYDDYLMPKNASCVGGVTALSSTTITVKADDAEVFWGVNYWPGIDAMLIAYDPAAANLEFSESRRVTANTAMTPGGTSVLTVDYPFNNSGYTRFALRGLGAPASLVWRKLRVLPKALGVRLMQRFGHAVPWGPMAGAVTMVTNPQANIAWSPGCEGPHIQFPATFDVEPAASESEYGHIVFHEPVVRPFSSMDSLRAGTPDGVPCDIIALLPYSAGPLTVVKPDSGFEGTAYTADGVEDVLYIDKPEWLDRRDYAAMAALAQAYLDTVKDTVIEGAITYYGKLGSALVKGKSVNISHPGYATGMEAAKLPMRGIVLDFAPGGGASRWITTIQFSNRMKPFSGDRLYDHASWGGVGQLSGVKMPSVPTRSRRSREGGGDGDGS